MKVSPSMIQNSLAGIGQEITGAHFRAHLAAVAHRAGVPKDKGICMNPILDCLNNTDIGVHFLNLVKVCCCEWGLGQFKASRAWI